MPGTLLIVVYFISTPFSSRINPEENHLIRPEYTRGPVNK
jgi:hypothetical protein